MFTRIFTISRPLGTSRIWSSTDAPHCVITQNLHMGRSVSCDFPAESSMCEMLEYGSGVFLRTCQPRSPYQLYNGSYNLVHGPPRWKSHEQNHHLEPRDGAHLTSRRCTSFFTDRWLILTITDVLIAHKLI
jgi:hypothetical protein